MGNPTTYNRTLGGSVGAGLGSVFNAGGGKSYFILEHRVSSKYHKAGESQEIIVDQIEIGRDSKCQVQFDESFKTVSRRHAAIVRDGDNWKLIQLSQTNKTFLNGKPVAKEWYLQNGDEIQLSVNGPKLGFIIPQGNKSKTGSIALSRRLSLFRQQALKPYKTAMTIMSCALVVIIAASIGFGISSGKTIKGLEQEQERNRIAMDSISEARTRDSIEFVKKQEELIAKINKYNVKIEELVKKVEDKKSDAMGSVEVVGATTGNAKLDKCVPYVYFVYMKKIEIRYQGCSRVIENVGSGSGFMLHDGRFVTARHVVEPWFYPSDSDDKLSIACNKVASNGGKVICYLDAYSPTGQKLSFTSESVVTDRSSDQRFVMDDGSYMTLPQKDDVDWAYYRTNASKGLTYNNQSSISLPMQAELTVLGYPLGLGANFSTDISPIYAEARVAKQGLDKGVILTTATTFEHGNSGGPVFAQTKDGENFFVIGVASAVAGRSTGFVVPIAVVK